MGRKKFLKQIESLEYRIREHELKMREEKRRPYPDENRIKYWEREIAAFKDAIERAHKRLRRGK